VRRGGCGAAGDAEEAGVDDDRPVAQEAQEARDLGPGQPEGEGRGGEEGREQRERDDEERAAEVERHEAEEARGHRVAEEAAEAVIVHPAREGRVGRGEGGGGEQRHRREGGARHGAGLAEMQHEAKRPAGEGDRDAPGREAERPVQRVGDRGADDPEGVRRRIVRGREDRRIVGRVGPEHQREERPDAGEDEPQELGTAPAQGLLGIALDQPRAALALGP
jgi:hypothetical protein